MIKWQEKFSVGNPIIDEEHKELIRLINRIELLNDEARNGSDVYDKICIAVNELTNYTIYHFDHEESLFSNTEYLDIDVHKFQHKMLIKRIQSIDLNQADHNQVTFINSLLKDLTNWILDHVLAIDMGYREYL